MTSLDAERGGDAEKHTTAVYFCVHTQHAQIISRHQITAKCGIVRRVFDINEFISCKFMSFNSEQWLCVTTRWQNPENLVTGSNTLLKEEEPLEQIWKAMFTQERFFQDQ